MVLSTNNGKIKHITEEEEEKMYLDYVNNFLTVVKFSEHYGITYFSASTLIKNQRKKASEESKAIKTAQKFYGIGLY